MPDLYVGIVVCSVSLLQLSHRNVCRTSLGLQTKEVVTLSDLKVAPKAPRPSFQIISLTAMVMSHTGERMWTVVDPWKATLSTFKSGGRVEEDREQLGTMTLLVITISHQLVQLREVEVKS